MEIEVTEEFARWYEALSDREAERVTAVVDALETQGVSLREPYCKPIKGSRHESMHELRLRQKGSPYRILFCFDPLRRAILLIAGDKTGDTAFYERMIPIADELYDDYLEELRAGGQI